MSNFDSASDKQNAPAKTIVKHRHLYHERLYRVPFSRARVELVKINSD